MDRFGVGELVDTLYPFEGVTKHEAKKAGRILHEKFGYTNKLKGEIKLFGVTVIGIPDMFDGETIRELKTYFFERRRTVAFSSGVAQANIYCRIFNWPYYAVDVYDVIEDVMYNGHQIPCDYAKAEADIKSAIQSLERKK